MPARSAIRMVLLIPPAGSRTWRRCVHRPAAPSRPRRVPAFASRTYRRPWSRGTAHAASSAERTSRVASSVSSLPTGGTSRCWETRLAAPPGDLQVRLLAVDPGGNPVRSSFDVVVRDQSTRAHLETVPAMAERMRPPEAFPVTLRFANAAIRLHLYTSLVPVWHEDLADLTEHARACVLSYPGLRVVSRCADPPRELDGSEHALVAEAAERPDTEAVLELLRQLARARRIGALAHVVVDFATFRGDDRVRAFLADQVPGILANHPYGTTSWQAPELTTVSPGGPRAGRGVPDQNEEAPAQEETLPRTRAGRSRSSWWRPADDYGTPTFTTVILLGVTLLPGRRACRSRSPRRRPAPAPHRRAQCAGRPPATRARIDRSGS